MNQLQMEKLSCIVGHPNLPKHIDVIDPFSSTKSVKDFLYQLTSSSSSNYHQNTNRFNHLLITKDDYQFVCQGTLMFTLKNNPVFIHLTKAPGIRFKAADNSSVKILDQDYIKESWDGTITVANSVQEKVDVVLRSELEGNISLYSIQPNVDAVQQAFVACLLILLNTLQSTNAAEEEDYDYGDTETLEDCQYEIDFKTYKKTSKLDLCSSLANPTLKSRLQLHVFTNHTEDKIHLRAMSSSLLTNSKVNRSLISLTTDIIEDFKYATSILVIDDFQWISLSTLKSILSSLINADLNLLAKNLKKTFIVAKGGHKELLSCAGNFYPKQDTKVLNITATFTKPITCTKEKQQDRFFTLQEKLFVDQSNQKNFRLVEIHEDNPKKISRTVWFTCNNPKSCSNGVQKKDNLDKTANYVLKYLQKARTEKKATSG
ncbi:hypothetical protein I4U23_011746 [Adineta vaga]|nr:hypothetical protein I4U23_011746 [Adineta vaga]